MSPSCTDPVWLREIGTRGFGRLWLIIRCRRTPESPRSGPSGFPVSEALANEGHHRGRIVEPVGVVSYTRLVDDLDSPTQGLVSRFD